MCVEMVYNAVTIMLQETHTKLEATAAKLRASQEAAARELVEQQVGEQGQVKMLLWLGCWRDRQPLGTGTCGAVCQGRYLLCTPLSPVQTSTRELIANFERTRDKMAHYKVTATCWTRMGAVFLKLLSCLLVFMHFVYPLSAAHVSLAQVCSWSPCSCHFCHVLAAGSG
jgi:hypothetical protein